MSPDPARVAAHLLQEAPVRAQHAGVLGVPLDHDLVGAVAGDQGLTLVHFSAQRKRFVWHRG
jgi:hypothetical protein